MTNKDIQARVVVAQDGFYEYGADGSYLASAEDAKTIQAILETVAELEGKREYVPDLEDYFDGTHAQRDLDKALAMNQTIDDILKAIEEKLG